MFSNILNGQGGFDGFPELCSCVLPFAIFWEISSLSRSMDRNPKNEEPMQIRLCVEQKTKQRSGQIIKVLKTIQFHECIHQIDLRVLFQYDIYKCIMIRFCDCTMYMYNVYTTTYCCNIWATFVNEKLHHEIRYSRKILIVRYISR